MKKRKLTKKLSLKKEKIALLNSNMMGSLQGGGTTVETPITTKVPSDTARCDTTTIPFTSEVNCGDTYSVAYCGNG